MALMLYRGSEGMRLVFSVFACVIVRVNLNNRVYLTSLLEMDRMYVLAWMLEK